MRPVRSVNLRKPYPSRIRAESVTVRAGARSDAADFGLLFLLTAAFLGTGYALLWEPLMSRWLF